MAVVKSSSVAKPLNFNAPLRATNFHHVGQSSVTLRKIPVHAMTLSQIC